MVRRWEGCEREDSARSRVQMGRVGCSGQMVKIQDPLLLLSTMPWGLSTPGMPAATRSWPRAAWKVEDEWGLGRFGEP